MAENRTQFGTVGVLMGGPSSERTISLKSGNAIAAALKRQGLKVCAVELETADPAELTVKLREAGCTLAFIALHGTYGEDGTVQALLAEAGVPFTGSDEGSSRRAFHKLTTQNILKKAGILVPKYVSVSKDSLLGYPEICRRLGSATCVLKPVAEGSSIGVHIVETETDFTAGVEDALQYGKEVLVEAFIPGREVTVGILGRQALPVVEVVPKTRRFFDYTAKYEKGNTEYIVPAELEAGVTARLQEQALRVFDLLDCRHFARVDFILSPDGEAYCLEINTIPGFTETSLLPKAAAAAGIPFDRLTLQLVEYAYAQKEKDKIFLERR